MPEPGSYTRSQGCDLGESLYRQGELPPTTTMMIFSYLRGEIGGGRVCVMAIRIGVIAAIIKENMHMK